MNLEQIDRTVQGRFKLSRRIIPKGKREKIKKRLKETDVDPVKYLNISTSLIITTTTLITGLVMTRGITRSIGVGLIVFSGLYLLTIKIPDIIHRKHLQSLEKSMVKALRTVSTELSIKIPFQTCIKHAAEQDTPAGKKLRKVERKVERGSSYPKALTEMGKESSSRFMKRTARQLISIHSGDPIKGSEALKKTVKEQESILRSNMEEYNQKLLVYSLIFIATSAIIPSMFQALVIIGSNFLNLGITPLQALLIPAIGFPLLNIGIFIYITLKKP